MKNIIDRKLVVPYAPKLENLKPQLRKFNTELIFKHRDKLSTGNQVIYNKPQSLFRSGVYTISCKLCPKLYIGETDRKL